ncbi:MAG TPA: phosphomannomutase/phosphoglucomutase [Bacillota bacterium]|nr:phosphomannomutase/phosphoglucomutase [Bacillota bacterium]HOL10997.1 phosphomannomutase/phosphoglucomutase [Bacillota bacterium]HPO98875.1 phosphomannomutase/phosphoglucomutase [Bacillota bacterium]
MVVVNPEMFREYDIRGIADEDLKSEFMFLFGKAVAKYMKEHGETTILVGRDNRLSSDRIRDGLVAGLTNAGCKVVDIGTVISPLFYYSRVLYNINAGVMITASHNPSEFNGFKIALGSGTIYGEEIQKLLKITEELNQEIAILPIVESLVEYRQPSDDYLEMLCSKIRLEGRKLTVAVDCGNGTASLFAEAFLKKLGCKVFPIFCESDGNFPNHHPDPVSSKNLHYLRKLVLEKKADVGIGFDGDGDRLGVVDNEGQIIWGDQLMALYWREILPQYPGTQCIVEVKCSQALVEEIERLGGKPLFFRTGHSLIKAKMKEIGAVFTGEMSGHMFFADEYFGFDDAFYAAGRLLRILSRTGASLSSLLSSVPKYYSTAETKVPCADRDKFRVVELFKEKFRQTNEIIEVDGARVLFPSGWGLVRASNTQPVIVARCEAKNQADLEQITAQFKEVLGSFPEVGEFDWEY